MIANIVATRLARHRQSTRRRRSTTPRQHSSQPAAGVLQTRTRRVPGNLVLPTRHPQRPLALEMPALNRRRLPRALMLESLFHRPTHPWPTREQLQRWTAEALWTRQQTRRRYPHAPMPAPVASPWFRFAPGAANVESAAAVRMANASARAPTAARAGPVTRARPASASQPSVRVGSACTPRIAARGRCVSTLSATPDARRTAIVPTAPMPVRAMCAGPMAGPRRSAVRIGTARRIGSV